MELPHPLLAAWNRHLALERRRSVHTVRAYVACAQRLLQFLTVHCGASPSGALLAALPAADLRAYLAHRRAQGLGNASTARELSALRAFLAFAGGDDAVIPPLRGPRVKKGVPRPVAPDEVIALAEDVAENAAEPWIAARNWAVLLLLYGAGLRISEALSLTGADVPTAETIRITGKRGKTRIVPLLPQVREAVAEYAALCPYGVISSATSTIMSSCPPTMRRRPSSTRMSRVRGHSSWRPSRHDAGSWNRRRHSPGEGLAVHPHRAVLQRAHEVVGGIHQLVEVAAVVPAHAVGSGDEDLQRGIARARAHAGRLTHRPGHALALDRDDGIGDAQAQVVVRVHAASRLGLEHPVIGLRSARARVHGQRAAAESTT
jgi:site-specific recombinase XerD